MLPSEFQWPKHSINKSEAAALVLECLQTGLKEDCSLNLEDALILKDIYDCRKCTFAIAVSFLKGIIEPKEERLFGTKEICTLEELELYKERLFDAEKRLLPQKKNSIFLRVDFDKISELKPCIVIDVSEEGIHTVNGLIRMPLSGLKLNPRALNSYDRFSKIVFVCYNGANALLGAKIAKESGFKEIYYSSYI